MNFRLLFACALAGVTSLAACTAAQQQTVTTAAADAKVKLTEACTVVQPTLTDLAAAEAGVAAFATLAADNAKVCAAVASLDPTTVQGIVNTSIPEMITLVGALPIASADKSTITIALTAASIALSNFLAVYGAQPATTTTPVTPASGVVVS